MSQSRDAESDRSEHVREPQRGLSHALDYASRYFMGKANVQEAARRIAARLSELGVDYAVAGGLAVSAHGHVRVTTDVDLLMTSEGLEHFKSESLGLGWVERFRGSKGVRDTEHDVAIDILLTGDFPGDGNPKPVAFPDPSDVAMEDDGINVVTLGVLVELKLASGMTAPDRPRDLDDVIQLIRANSLARDFGAGLHEYVRDKYDELWGYAQRRSDDY